MAINSLFTSGPIKFKSIKGLYLALFLLLPQALAAAQDVGSIISEINFLGNEKTKVALLQRQMKLAVGDVYNQAKSDASRQGLMNLGLFKEVTITPESELGITKLTVKVQEKRYLLIYPRLSANGDGETSYGVTGAWANISGLNHKAKLTYAYKKLREEGLSNSQSLSLSYYAPFIYENWDASIDGRYSIAPVDDIERNLQYELATYRAEVGGSLRFANSDVVNGHRLNVALLYWQYIRDYQDEQLSTDEYTVAARVGISKRDIDYQLYSDLGEEWSISREQSLFAAENRNGNRFEYNLTEASYTAYLPGIAEAENHNFIVDLNIGHLSGGPSEYDRYAVSSKVIRGYEKGTRDGNTFFSARAEYLLPTYRYPALRWLVHLDSAAILPDDRSEHGDDVLWSVGLGMRWRPKWFVNLEIDLTLSYPLNGNDDEGLRVSGGTRRLGR